VSSAPEKDEERKCAGRFTPIPIARTVHPVDDIVSIFRLFRYIKKNRFTIVHTHTAKAGFVGTIAGWLAGVPVIHTYHGLPYYQGQPFLAYLLYSMAEQFLCLFRARIYSQNEIDLTILRKQFVTKHKSYPEGNSVDSEYIQKNAKKYSDRISNLFSSDCFHLLCVSRLETIKSIEKVLEVAEYLKNKSIKFDCIIAGKGHLDKHLESEIIKRDLTGTVKIVYTPYIHALIDKADLLILTSMKEGVPRSVLEAMALKKTVIATDVQGTREVVVHNENGILVPYNDQMALEEQTENLINNASLRERLGNNGFAILQKKYVTEEKIAELWITMYTSMTPARKKSVLFVTTVGFTTEAFLLPYIQWFKDKGYDVDSCANWNYHWNKLPESVNKVSMPFSRNAFSIINIAALCKCVMLLIKKRYTLIYTHTPNASMIIRAARFLSLSKAKVLYEIHGLHVHDKGNYYSNLLFTMIESFFSLLTDGIITINNDDFTFANKHFKHPKNYYVPGIGVDTTFYVKNETAAKEIRTTYQIQEGTPVIVTIADFIKRKRIDLCIHAASCLKKRNVTFKWLIAGTGPLVNDIKQLITSLGLSDNVVLMGYQSDVRRLLSVADVFVLLSIQEGLPRSILEAGSMGIPVVASNIRGNRDIIKHGVNSFLVELEDIPGIVKCICSIIEDKSLQDTFGKKLQETVCTQYSLQNALNEHACIFESL
jgi:glycosyltransferase involved in cell wall biosynthesis